jgi:hypothetical protein
MYKLICFIVVKMSKLCIHKTSDACTGLRNQSQIKFEVAKQWLWRSQTSGMWPEQFGTTGTSVSRGTSCLHLQCRLSYPEDAGVNPCQISTEEYNLQPNLPVPVSAGDLVHSREQSILAKFQYPMSCRFCGIVSGKLSPLKIIITFVLYKLHSSYGACRFYRVLTMVQWLRLALSKGPNRIGVSPSPEDGNRSSFRNVVFVFFLVIIKIRTMDKVQNPSNSVSYGACL